MEAGQETELENKLELQLFALAFRIPGAIEIFQRDLAPHKVGLINDRKGLYEFYSALLDFYDKTGLDPVDPIAFHSWLQTETEISDVLGGADGAQAFIGRILDVELSTPEAVVRTLNHRANKQKQQDLLLELTDLINQKGNKSDQELDRLRQLTEEIHNLETGGGGVSLDSVTTAYDIAERAGTLTNLPDFIPTPFKSLNRAMGYHDNAGLFRGAVHAVIAESGKGKSTFCKCCMNYIVDEGYSVLFINFEEAQQHWETTLFTQIIQENVYANATLWSPGDRAKRVDLFQAKLNEWGNRFMVKHDPDTSYFSDLEEWIRNLVGNSGISPDVIVIDTIQSLIEKGKGARWAEFEFMMIRLEKLARDLNAAVVITAQQNTEAMKENREVIKQSDTGGSIAIQQKSSITMFLTPAKIAMNDDSVEETIMQLQIPKNRITGTVFTMDPPVIKYNDSTKSYEEFEQVTGALYEPIAVDGINLLKDW